MSAETLGPGPGSFNKADIIADLATRRFTGTGSTQLEIQTLLWALEDYQNGSIIPCSGKLSVYTDSQCVAGLLRRRSGLEKRNYISKKTNKVIPNASLYRRFYSFYDELDITIVKVAGHGGRSSNDAIPGIFSIVDREVRKALRSWMDEMKRGR